MKWLADFFATAVRWVLKNPLLIVLVIVISLYNQFGPDLPLDMSQVDPLSAASIWELTLVALQFLLSPHGATIMALSLFLASLLTMFNVGAMLAVFGTKANPAKNGFRTAVSLRTMDYFALQVAVSWVFAGVFLLCIWLLVPVAGMTGLFGSLIIGACTAVGYVIAYILISTSSLILAVPVSSTEQFAFARVLFGKKNLPRLLTFYFVRMGAEAVVVYIVLIVAHLFHFPALISGLLVVIAVSVPFAIVRTTGLVMKLDMLRDTPWFADYFRAYYEQAPRGTVPLSTMYRGTLFAFTAPTGAGKGSLMEFAIQRFPEIQFPYSYTTRPRRATETTVNHYRFISKEEFEQRIANDEFLEWAIFNGNYYGTLTAEVESHIAAGHVLLKEIEAQGARKIKKVLPKEELVIVTIDGGPWEVLEKRIRARAPITDEEVAGRRKRYEDEMTFIPEADVVIRNHEGELEQAKKQLEELIQGALDKAKSPS